MIATEMKTIIAGSRTFNDYELLRKTCGEYIITEVVSGTAQGADKLGERYAKERGIPIGRFHANWTLHGKSAGFRRNIQMADYAEALIAFWDGESRGTKHMIDIAKDYELKVTVVKY